MVNYALSPAAGQALISGLNTEFMCGLPQRIEASSYLIPEVRGALCDFYDRGPSPRRMQDALGLGIVGSGIADDKCGKLRVEGASLHGPGRLRAELPTVNRPGDQLRDMQEFGRHVAEVIRHGNPSATVIEMIGIHQDSMETRIDRHMQNLLNGAVGGRPLHVGREAGGVLRFPSISLLESLLQYLHGDQGPLLCCATYLIDADRLNALHEFGYRTLALLLEAASFDGRRNKAPIEALFHDLGHTTDYILMTSMRRRLAAQFLRIMEPYCAAHSPQQLARHPLLGLRTLRVMPKLVLDLQGDHHMLTNILLEVFRAEYALEIGGHFLGAMEEYEESHSLSSHELEELRRSMANLVEGLAKLPEAIPTQNAAVA